MQTIGNVTDGMPAYKIIYGTESTIVADLQTGVYPDPAKRRTDLPDSIGICWNMDVRSKPQPAAVFEKVTKIYRVGWRSRRITALDQVSLSIPAGRSLWPDRSESRRQDHAGQDPAVDLPADRRPGHAAGQPPGRIEARSPELATFTKIRPFPAT